MAFGSLSARLRLRTKLLIVVLVPLLGMTAFAGLWAAGRLQEARGAEAELSRVSLSVELADLLSDVRLDGALTVALAGAGQLASPQLSPFAALATAQVAPVRARIEERRRVLSGRADEIDRLGGSWRAAEAQIASLGEARARISRQAGPDGPPERVVDAAFDEYARAAAAMETVLFDLARPAQGSAATAVTLAGLSSAEGRALREMIAVNALAFRMRVRPASREEIQEIAALVEARSAEMRLLLPLLPPRTLDALRSFNGSADEAAWAELCTGLVARGAAPSIFRAAPIALRRITGLAEVRAALGAELVTGAQRTAAEARGDFLIALLIALTLIAATLVLALVVIRSSTVTLGRLERRARRIGEGDLNMPPLHLAGRDETAVLATSFDQMTSTLRTLEEQMSALADGRGDDPVLRRELPGRLGAALQGSVRQVTDATTRLRSSEALSRLIVDTAAEAIWTVDANGRVATANRASAELVGIPPAEMVGMPLTSVLRIGPAGHALPGARITNRETLALHRDGREVPVLVSMRSIRDADGAAVTTVFARDISERIELERRLAHEATHDALTGLPNRQALLSLVGGALGRSAARGGGFGVLFVDLDRFKAVNDALGHRSGDAVLKEVACRLRGGIRDGDVVARLGGDEFVVIGETLTDPAEAQALARRLVALVEEGVDVGGAAAHVSASVGVYWHEGGGEPAEIIRRADIAMFRAKESGPGQVVVFDTRLSDWVREREGMEHALRQAIGAGELSADFQPIVDLETGRVTAAELLARWRRPGTGEVPPAVFIPVAEESGLIVDVGRWALREACRRAVAWRRRHPGLDLRVAVNISGLHVTRGDILGDVRAALAESGARPSDLRIELTETHLLDDAGGAHEALTEISRLGVGLSIDDFGTGYSSLTYLRRLPVDEVKIDRSFVARLGEDAHDRSIIELIGALGQTLGIGTIAEGIETPEQVEILRSMGLRSGQGYLFSRPLPADAFEGWLEREQAVPAV